MGSSFMSSNRCMSPMEIPTEVAAACRIGLGAELAQKPSTSIAVARTTARYSGFCIANSSCRIFFRHSHGKRGGDRGHAKRPGRNGHRDQSHIEHQPNSSDQPAADVVRVEKFPC